MRLGDLPRAPDGVPAATAAQMAEIDRVAIAELGVPLEALMENAARQVAAATRALLGEVEDVLVTAVVGTGNNGGDALAALRHLLDWGAQVDAYVAAPADRLHATARRQYDILARLDVPLYDTTAHDDRFIAHRLAGRSAVIDGLLGYSTSGAARGEIERLITITNGAGSSPVVAVDLPSGLDPDSGMAHGAAIRAQLTVTLALPKAGLLAEAARPLVGDLLLADIGIPARAYERAGLSAPGLFARGDLLRLERNG